ncbi:MAG: ABC transporter substrate-binding protein, partial [[Clostridium] cellulosi]
MKIRRIISLALASAMIVGVLTGCKSQGSTNPAETPIRVCVGSEPKSIDPAINQAVDGSIYIVHAFEGLTKYDKNAKIVPGVAKSWDISDDQLTYTFHLREDAKW